MLPIRFLESGLPIEDVLKSISEHPDVWNRHTIRTGHYGPHRSISDIWCRYNDIRNFDGDRERFNGPHESIWYPAADEIGVKPLVEDVVQRVGGKKLGGVLITKIPAHENCMPHVDRGWHAEYYEKFAVQLASNDQQAFHFDGVHLVTKPGDLFWFDNSKTHWVTNPSDEDRMTLIICIRRI